MRTFLHWTLSLLLFFCLADNILWINNFPLAGDFQDIDPECMWYNHPGTHRDIENERATSHIWDNGMRASRPQLQTERPFHVLCMGCSYTYGVGINDEETYVWKLNELMPQVEFDNGAVGGYGPLRSLIRQKRYQKRKAYDLVIYAMLDSHLERGSVPKTRLELRRDKRFDHQERWLSDLYILPFTQLSENFRFIDHPLYTLVLPYDRYSPLLNFYKQFFITHKARALPVPDHRTQSIVMADQVNRMAQVAASYGSRFLLITLDGIIAPRPLLDDYITVWDNNYFRPLRDSDKVGGHTHNHPLGYVHTFWAEKLANYLSQPENRAKLIEHRDLPHQREHRTLYNVLNPPPNR